MYQELTNLAEDFARYRGRRKRVKYPQVLWDRAVRLCERHPLERIAEALQVCGESLRRHLQSGNKENGNDSLFVPINITPTSSVQIHVNGPLSMTVDFDRSTEELAKFILRIQSGLPC